MNYTVAFACIRICVFAIVVQTLVLCCLPNSTQPPSKILEHSRKDQRFSSVLRSKSDCYAGNGENYRGDASVTEKGSKCQPWTIDKAPINMFKVTGKGLGKHNFCRNPDGDSRPWCWVNATGGIFGYCKLFQCKPKSVETHRKLDCKPKELYCISTANKVGICLNSTKVCDNEKDCTDSEDESEELCATICKNTEFLCRRGKGSLRCLPKHVKCDGLKHCPDGEDEENCPYQGGDLDFFTPRLNTRLLVHRYQFENLTMKSCAEKCKTSATLGIVCSSFNFLLPYGFRKTSTCEILKSKRRQVQGNLIRSRSSIYFDFRDDCGARRAREAFRCKNMRCIDVKFRCNGKDDCGDNTDEEKCSPSGEIKHDVRVIGGRDQFEGRLEVTYPEYKRFYAWRPVCHSTDTEDSVAVVICRQHGFSDGRFIKNSLLRFGRSAASSWILLRHQCSGKESVLNECEQNIPIPANTTTNVTCDYEVAAGIMCSTRRRCSELEFKCSSNGHCIDISFVCDGRQDCTDNSDEVNCETKIQLQGGTDVSGLIVIERNGISGTVCDDDFDDTDALVACRMMGFDGKAKAIKDGRFGRGKETSVIWLDDLQCNGTESHLLDCPESMWLRNNCNHTEDVGVQCAIYDTTTSTTTTTSTPTTTMITPSTTTSPTSTASSTSTTQTSTIPHVTVPPLKPSPVMCGLKFVRPRRSLRRLGSYEAQYGEFPWQVGIRRRIFSLPEEHWCGGTIINNLWILTAAHCFKRPKEHYTLRVGDWDNSRMDKNEQHFKIKRLLIHPNWTGPPLYNNDIAMVKIKPNGRRGIDFGTTVQPACLPEPNEKRSSAIRCHISGWGSTGSNVYPTKLRVADVPFISDSECHATYGNRLTSMMQCAGFLHGGVDTCQGDSGGPLVCRTLGERERYVLWGITSWGEECAKPDNPGVYTRVNKYLKWIEHVIKYY